MRTDNEAINASARATSRLAEQRPEGQMSSSSNGPDEQAAVSYIEFSNASLMA